MCAEASNTVSIWVVSIQIGFSKGAESMMTEE